MHLALNSLRDGRGERRGESLDGGARDWPAVELPDHAPSAEQSLVARARLEEVREAIRALPDKQRAAVLLHKYQEMEYSQIARILNCSESAVKSLLFRAYETLRARLAHMA
jgi:RNA polymerase sigma-70 factor (ECF subfamily)